MAQENCSCEICAPGGLGLLQESSGFNHNKNTGTYGNIYQDYADYFYAHGEIASLSGRSKKGIRIVPGTKVVSEAKGYVPPYLRKTKVSDLPFYKPYFSGSDDIYAYKGRKFGMAKFYEGTRIPSGGRKAVPYVEGYAIRKKFNKKKRRIGFWCSFVPLVITVLAAIMLFV
ncbi:MAG: hypothetical protein IKB56_05595 [Clostridia bacterium]|nr:hypothetical protein [Clostridia bacterium]